MKITFIIISVMSRSPVELQRPPVLKSRRDQRCQEEDHKAKKNEYVLLVLLENCQRMVVFIKYVDRFLWLKGPHKFTQITKNNTQNIKALSLIISSDANCFIFPSCEISVSKISAAVLQW